MINKYIRINNFIIQRYKIRISNFYLTKDMHHVSHDDMYWNLENTMDRCFFYT